MKNKSRSWGEIGSNIITVGVAFLWFVKPEYLYENFLTRIFSVAITFAVLQFISHLLDKWLDKKKGEQDNEN